MPKTRKSEPTVVLSAAAAVPARRKTATAKSNPAVPSRTPSTVTEPEAAIVELAEVRTVPAPSPEEIAEVAYLYWVARGYQGGSQEEDWLRAEDELRQRSLALA
jgi:Protein of unknown function (DUF2934)